MDFELVSTNYDTIKEDIKENNNDDKKVSSVQLKRQNKTETCEKCGKKVNSKTLKYSHDCTKEKRSLEDKRNNRIVKNENNNDNQNQNHNQNQNQYKIYNEPNDDDLEEYLMKRERIHREKQAIIRAEKFQRLISNAF